MPFYTTEILSANQELTPEGFLACKGVPIARTGTQTYLEAELIDRDGKPLIEGTPEGLVFIERHAEDVFRPQTMASFEGKPVTITHPSADVTPENWGSLAKGVVLNARRGSGLEADLLLADLLITDMEAIALVRGKDMREVSCGYEAIYEQVSPGRGRQTNIVGNHLALVEQGRCGERCAIGDEAPMKNKWMGRILAAFTARDEAALKTELENLKVADEEETEEERKKREAEEKKSEDRKTSDAIASLTARIAKLEDKRAKDEGEEETEEERKKREAKEAKDAKGSKDEDENEDEKEGQSAEDRKRSKDAAAAVWTADASLVTLVSEVHARAEILAPGLKLPTHDKAATAKSVRDGLCALKRQALAAAAANAKTSDAVKPLMAGVALDKLSCDALHSTFIGASELVRISNNAGVAAKSLDTSKGLGNVSTIAEMNKRNNDFWSKRS